MGTRRAREGNKEKKKKSIALESPHGSGTLRRRETLATFPVIGLVSVSDSSKCRFLFFLAARGQTKRESQRDRLPLSEAINWRILRPFYSGFFFLRRLFVLPGMESGVNGENELLLYGCSIMGRISTYSFERVKRCLDLLFLVLLLLLRGTGQGVLFSPLALRYTRNDS